MGNIGMLSREQVFSVVCQINFYNPKNCFKTHLMLINQFSPPTNGLAIDLQTDHCNQTLMVPICSNDIKVDHKLYS